MNKHIEENLKHYISQKNPEFAVLLSGKWGSGKTFFIDDFVKNYNHNIKNQDIQFIKISLFGLKNIDSIDEQIFQELHPILGSKYAKFAGNIFKGALKLGINIDIDGDNKNDGKASIDLTSLNIFSKDEEKSSSKELIFIFDDLERTDIELTEILGYINYFVEQSNFKVITLASEEKIKEYDKNEKFKEFKEKVIGKTFEVKQNFDEVLTHFLNLEIESKTTLETNKQSIKDIYLKAGYENLRHVRQSILDFDYLYKMIDKKYKDNNEYIKNFIYVFFVLSIEIKKGELVIDEFINHNKNPWEGFSFGNSEEKKKKEKTKFEKILIKYNLLAYEALLLSTNNWIDILFKSKIIKEYINTAISDTSYFRTKKRDSWIDLWYFRDLEDDEFKSILADVVQKFNDNKYVEHEMMLHVIALLLNFSKIGIYHKTSKEIIKQAKININGNKETELWKTEKYTFDSYNKYSLGYYNKESKEFIEIKNYLVEKSSEAFTIGLKDKANTLLEDFQNNDIDAIRKKLHEEFRDIAIFTQIEQDNFINIFSGVKHSNLCSIANIIKDRYELYRLRDSNTLLKELDFWKEINNSLLSNINTKDNPVKYYLLESFKNYSLKEIIDNLNKTTQQNLATNT